MLPLPAGPLPPGCVPPQLVDDRRREDAGSGVLADGSGVVAAPSTQQAVRSDAREGGRHELGAARKLTLTTADKRRTAYHESGHALVGMLTPGADPVRKISIIPHDEPRRHPLGAR